MKKHFPPSMRLIAATAIALGLFIGTSLSFPSTAAPIFTGATSGFTSTLGTWWSPQALEEYDPKVSTDKLDYSPGEIVRISGSGFRPNEMVTLQIVHVETTSGLRMMLDSVGEEPPHSGHEPWDVMVNADGTFESSWVVELTSLNKTLLLTADQPARDGLDALHAEVTFTDGQVGEYDQCSNDQGVGYDTGNPDEGCNWINGNLNANNSSYPEGTSTVQRAELVGFGPNEYHSVTFQYGTTKNGKHAYDFLTGWDWSEKWITVEDRCEGIEDCETAPEVSAAIPLDPNLPDVAGTAWEIASISPDAPDTANRFVMRGGTFEKNGGGSPVSTPQFQDPGMSYAGTSETLITVFFKTGDVGSDMCETSGGQDPVTMCRVALWFGAHVAKTPDWLAENGTTGAGSISGSPYHVAIFRLDGLSIGNRDNQMQAGAVTTQSLEVRKELVPASDPGRFDLQIDAGTANAIEAPNQGDDGTTGAREVGAGNHTVSEVGGDTPATNLANYTTTLSCVTTASNGQETTQNFGSTTGPQTVNVPTNGDVVCTFTNTPKTGSLQIVKQTVGGIAGKNYDWFFSTSGFNGNANIELNTSGINGTDASDVFQNLLTSGDYDVAEIIASNPAGWDLTSAVCKIGSETVDGPTDIEIRPNQTTICTFTNTEDVNETRGRIRVDKVTDPAGATASFTFSPVNFNGDATFPLTDGATPFLSELIVPSADTALEYSVSESSIPAGWDLTSAQCKLDDGAGAVTGTSGATGVTDITVEAGKVTRCVFTNTYEPSVTIDKTGDTLSKIGDPVDYTITVNNTSAASAGAPNLACTVTDATVGLNETIPSFAPGVEQVFNVDDFVIPAGAADPFPNTASISCTYVGIAGQVASDSDGHNINLFQPSITLDKTVDDHLAMVGDTLNYTITVTNTSSADTPNLVGSVVDAMLGIDQAVNMAPGAVVVINASHVVTAGDPDPLNNTATVTTSPNGFPNIISASDSETVNLFQPSFTIDKTGDALSKAGDPVNYTITVTNTSSVDTPVMSFSLSDSLLTLAPADASFTLASGASRIINVSRTVLAGDPDPLVNTATAVATISGESFSASASDSHSTNLFQPSVALNKTGDTLSKIGDQITYTFTVTNTSSADSPNLILDSFTDDRLGVLAAPAACDNLAPGATCTFSVPYTIQPTDPDPLVNTATVHYHPLGFPNDISASDGHSVNLFQPSISLDKTGDTLSKVGDPVNYTLTLTNTSSADAPDLVCTITDTMLSINKQVTIASGASDVTNAQYTVQASDPDPLVNTATASCSPLGFPNVLTASDSHSVNLFQPSITFDKSGDELSKVGDDVNYTLTLSNTSSSDAPSLVCTITDEMLGVNKQVTLASGANNVTNVPYTVKASDSDPLPNTASVSCSPQGFPNVLTASDSHSVNLFQPSIVVTKTGPPFSKAGDVATYQVTIQNTSSADSPNLVLDSFSDSLVAGVDPPAACDNLAPGASCQFSYNRTVLAGDPDPLPNTATAHYHPVGFPNDIADSDTYNTDLLHPAFSVTKVCKAEPVSRTGPAVFTITFNNTGDADLHVVPSEGDPFDVAAGGTHSYDYSINGPFTANVPNTVTGNVTLASRYGLPNSYTFSASDTCDIEPLLIVIKHVINNNGGQAEADDFTMQVTGTNVNPASFDGSETGTNVILDAGTFNVGESMPIGPQAYAKSYPATYNVPGLGTVNNACNSSGDGSIANGQTKYCIVVNDDLAQTLVTSSSLCTFDVDPSTPCKDFRLLFTPSMQNPPYKLNATNPGQTFYNVFYAPVNPDGEETIYLTIPYPYVTHGATPIHVYGDDTTVKTVDGQQCIIPGETLYGFKDQIVLGDHVDTNGTPDNPWDDTKTIAVTFDWPDGEAFVYINIHLDYGLKGTAPYAKGANDNALNPNTLAVLIPNHQEYTFHAENSVPLADDEVCSLNSFKKNPGAGGLNQTLSEEPVKNAKMELRNARGQLVTSSLTDEDGWYFLTYKHTGKAADYVIVSVGSGAQKKITLKANAFVQVDFP